MFIASKVGFQYPGVPRSLKASLIEEECNKSLKRMNIETFDLYYAHVDDRVTPLEESLEAFDRLVKAGKVRLIGASNYLAWRLEQARWLSQTNDWGAFCCVQQHHTYLRLRAGTNIEPQEMANEDLFDYCRTTGLTLLGYSVLQAGAYTREDRSFREIFASEDNQKRLEVLRAVAEEVGATANQVVLRWMLQSSPAVIPLIAASDEAQLQENLNALNIQLSAEQIQRLNAAGTQ
jgi:aryl-alcohol dehydrogenase-like predicted oxidoreductase